MEQIFSHPIVQFIINNPIKSFIYLVLGVLLYKFSFWFFRNFHRYLESKKLVFLKVTMPRDDSNKDREKENEKDFREKISVMSQLYRSLNETRELNMINMMKVKLFQHNIFTFELVAEDEVVNFYITTPDYYKGIVEKQITTYYPGANIDISKEPYRFFPEGNKFRGFFGFTQNDYYFPIKTYKIVENDPLNGLTNIFSKLTKDETAAIQLVLRPRNSKWSKKTTRFGEAYYKGKSGKKSGIPILGGIFNIIKGIVLGYDKMDKPVSDEGGGFVRMLQAKEEVAKRIGEKASQAGFDAILRLTATAKTERRAEEIVNNTIISFGLYKDELSNWIQTKRVFFIDFINDLWMKFTFKHRLIDNRFLFIGEKKSLLAEDELSSIFHFPHSRYNTSPSINWLDYKVLPPPVNLPREGVLLGHNVYRGVQTPIRFMKKDRSRHHYIIGKSGSGKSALLSFMARQDILNGEGVCVIDPHGDLVDDILKYIPASRAKDVIIFDPADVERPMSINMLEAKTSAQQDLASSQATEIFIKLFGDEIFGPRIQHYFRNACLTLMEDQEEGATLIDVPRIFTDNAFLNYKVKKVRNPVVKSFWEHEYANTGDRERQEMIPYFSSKFGPFITNSIMRNTIGQAKSSFNFREVMDQQKILLVKLSKGTIGDLNTQLLGLVMVARIQMAAMSRADIPEHDRKDFFLYVDEFQNFATDSFSSILSEARKYRLNLIMAHQYINQLVVSKFGNTSTQIRDAVFGNVGTLCSFKVGAEDAEYLAKEYAPLLTEQDIIGISNYKMYMKLNINNTTSRPFSVNTIWDTTGKNDELGEKIRELSRLRNARRAEFVEKEITNRIGIDMEEENTPPPQAPTTPPSGG